MHAVLGRAVIACVAAACVWGCVGRTSLGRGEADGGDRSAADPVGGGGDAGGGGDGSGGDAGGDVNGDPSSADTDLPPPVELLDAEAQPGATSAELSMRSNRTGVVYVRVRDAAWPGATPAALRAAVQAGLPDANDRALASPAVVADLATVEAVTGLAEATAHWVYLVPEAAGGELGALVTELSFTTAARMPIEIFTSTSQPGIETYVYVYLPEAYYTSGDSFPLLVFLHGWGEKTSADGGADVGLVLVHGVPKLIAQGNDYPFIAVSPQCNDLHWDCWNWTVALTDELVEESASRYRVDRRRVYVTGLSTGGGGAYNYAKAHPTKVAAILPISTIPVATGTIANLAGIPVWDFHCADDTMQPATNSTSVLTALQDAITLAGAGPSPLYTEYPAGYALCLGGSRHNAWATTYDQTSAPYPTTIWFDGSLTPTPTDIYVWLLQQAKP